MKRRAPWAAYLWPGLPHLWIRGSWAGLFLAVGFTALLHITVFATLVWPEWLPPRVVMGCGATLGLLWLAALWETRGELRRLAEERSKAEEALSSTEAGTEKTGEQPANNEPLEQDPEQDPVDKLFVEAQTHYLRADWVATETTLLDLLQIDREDVEAHLLLATLWRRIGRTRDARRRLRQLSRREAAAEWLFEIQTELDWCHNAENPDNPKSAVENPEIPEAIPIPAAQPSDARQTEPERADRNAA